MKRFLTYRSHVIGGSIAVRQRRKQGSRSHISSAQQTIHVEGVYSQLVAVLIVLYLIVEAT
jgi:hypothetical protein